MPKPTHLTQIPNLSTVRASSHSAVNVAVLGVTHGLHPDVVEDGPQLVGHVGHVSSLVDCSLPNEGKIILLGNLFLSIKKCQE